MIKDNVQRGIDHLNEVRPGWENEIDLSTLSIGSEKSCVMGQLFENCYEGFQNKDDPDYVGCFGEHVQYDKYVEHGFFNYENSSIPLTEEWAVRIRAMRA